MLFLLKELFFLLHAFNEDTETKIVVMIGEIGGDAEEKAAEWIQKNMKKPVVCFIGGKTAPKGKQMGHAGAIISSSGGGASEKIKTLHSAGVVVTDNLESLVSQVLLIQNEHEV